MTEATRKYVLKAGFSHTVRDQETGELRQLRAGSVVELNRRQATAFADRFELLESVQARAAAEAAMLAAAEGEAEAIDKAATPMPAAAAATAEVATPAPKPVEPVDVDKFKADELVAKIGKCKTEAEVRAIADPESKRSRPRTSVLTAADEKLEELGALEE